MARIEYINLAADKAARLRKLRDGWRKAMALEQKPASPAGDFPDPQPGRMVALPEGWQIARPQEQQLRELQLQRAVAEGQKALLRELRRDLQGQLRNVASDLPADATGQEAGRREVLRRQKDQLNCYLQQAMEAIRQLDDRVEKLAAEEVDDILAGRQPADPQEDTPAAYSHDMQAWLLQDHNQAIEDFAEQMRELGRQQAERVEREFFAALGIPANFAGVQTVPESAGSGQAGPQLTGPATVHFWPADFLDQLTEPLPDTEPADSPAAAAVCPDCNGTGQYQGLLAVEPCRSCCGSEGVPECGD